MSDTPHASNLRKGRVSLPNAAYFVTKCVVDKLDRPLGKAGVAEILIRCLLWMRGQGRLRILGFAVMPDHYHLALGLASAELLSEIVESIDKFTARGVNTVLGRTGTFWQPGFYEHLIRDRVDFDGILEYIHSNPVRAGLALSEGEWPYSTGNGLGLHW